MHITKIELEDIKSHVDSKFEFTRGTTAIMGDNGAGKTTLIEAVAWVLFDLLDYKKSDFVRRGAKKGVARVTFESGLDERRYVVHRDTKTGYYVYDPKLKTRIADKKEEVTRFLWQHLGVETGTDLEALFRRAIGVPQGTFTATFLEPPTERKKAFDKLLKVEEYRQSADKLRETGKYIDGKVINARENIARAEGELTKFDQLKADLKKSAKESKKLEKKSKSLESDVAAKRKIVKKFEKIEATVSELKRSLEKIENEKSTAEVVKSQREKEVKKSEEAAATIKDVETDYKKHLKALGMIKELERERVEREKLKTELAKIENAIVNVKADQKTTNEDFKKVLAAHREIEELRPKVLEQEGLERKRESLRNLVSESKSSGNQIEKLNRKIEKLRDRYRENSRIKAAAEEKSAEAQFLNERQAKDDELRKELARLEAKLDRDQKFQREVQDGLCPILSEKCLNMKDGKTLEDFVQDQFSEVKEQIAKLETEQTDLSKSLAASREAEKFAARLESIQKREEEVSKEGQNLNKEVEALRSHSRNLGKYQEELKETEAQLKKLDNPKARIKILEHETAREISLRERITKIESNLERLESDRGLKVEQIETYKDLDSNWNEYSAERERTREPHSLFIANEATAKLLSERKKELETVKSRIGGYEKELVSAAKAFEKESSGFDIEKYSLEKATLAEMEKQLVETTLNLKHAENQKLELETEIERLKKVREALDTDKKEKARLEKIRDITAFIRATLKEAAPRVARNYVYHVSIEANQMFREVTGNAERTLKWGDDYGILLEENGFDRPFQNLSGGEQMAAALSVRLALLKQLSDIRIAFFDEPTMSLDAEHRDRLADQISQIAEKKTFDQLFVISHDDAFETYVDTVVTVTNEITGEQAEKSLF